MDIISCIYCIENIVNGKKYIGQTINFNQRIHCHRTALRSGKHVNLFLQRSWDKFSEENFDIYIVEYGKPELLSDREIYYISLYQTKNDEYGYNLTDGGEGIPNPSEMARRHMSDAHKGKILSKEQREKISSANKGRPAHNKGVKRTEEECRKISEGQIGRVVSEETRNKIGSANKGSTSARGVSRIPNHSSKFVGVYLYKTKTCDKYYSHITVNNKTIYLGHYDTEREAAIAYNNAALKYYGADAILNDVN